MELRQTWAQKNEIIVSTTWPLTLTSPNRILDWTRALLIPLTREEIHESSLTLPESIGTVSLNLTPEKLGQTTARASSFPSDNEAPKNLEMALTVIGKLEEEEGIILGFGETKKQNRGMGSRRSNVKSDREI